MCSQASSSDATLWTSLLVTSARPTRILFTHLMERPKLFTTLELSLGALVQKATVPITPGWTQSLSATEGLLRYTFFSIQNSRSCGTTVPHGSSAMVYGSLSLVFRLTLDVGFGCSD